jgi:NAD(P)H dehydrogenase (quinone)
MKILIVYSHFNPASFNHALLKILQDNLGANNIIKTKDLYAENFNPVLTMADMLALEQGTPSPDIRAEQEFVEWADMIIFVYPIWWQSMPAILKGYIDRVFSFGFAYTVDESGPRGLLMGKKVYIVNTTGATEEENIQSGVFESIRKLTDIGIFSFCGMEVIGHHYLSGVPYVTDKERQKMLDGFSGTAVTLNIKTFR